MIEIMHSPGTSQSPQNQRIYEYVEIFNDTNDNIALTRLDTTTNNTVNTTHNLVGLSGPIVMPPRTMRIIAPGGLKPTSDEDFRCEWQLLENDIIRIPVDQFENMFSGSRLLLFGESNVLLDAVNLFPPDFWTSDPGVGDSQAVHQTFLFGQPLNERTNDPIIVWPYIGPKNFLGIRTSTSGVGLGSPGFIPAGLNDDFQPEQICVAEPKGGCCIPDGRCVALTEDGCEDRGGDYSGDLVFCSAIPDCPAPQIGNCCTPGGACLAMDSYTCQRASGSFSTSTSTCESACDSTSGVVINEVDYNQLGIDVGEYVELYGPAGQSIFGHKLIFYDGSPDDRSPYREVPLAGFIPGDEHFVVGSAQVPNVLQVAWTVDAIKNDAPNGIVLTKPAETPPFEDIVVQAISYGGSFVGAAGPAAGVTFVDMGVTDQVSANQDLSAEVSLQRLPNVFGDWVATSDDGLGPDGTPGLINELPFPAVRGACCLPVGTCLGPLERIGCDGQGGVYQGDGTNCGIDCPGTTGACCLPGGNCVSVSADECGDANGLYFGNGVNCIGIPACPSPPIGACCVAAGGCVAEDVIDCESLGGVFRGNGTSCNTQNCGPLASVVINEISRNDPGIDDREFIEIFGPGGMSLDGFGLIEIEGDTTLVGQEGRIDHAFLLTSVTIPTDGFLVLGDAILSDVDLVIGQNNTLENGSATYALISGFNAVDVTAGTDVDVDNDGVVDPSFEIGTIVDALAIVDGEGKFEDRVYLNAVVIGGDPSSATNGVARRRDGRDANSPDDFCALSDTDDGTDGLALPTPGRTNFCGSCPTPGDANHDLSIDLLDLGSFQACFGLTVSSPMAEPPPRCRCFDSNADQNVSLLDFAWFQSAIQGP